MGSTPIDVFLTYDDLDVDLAVDVRARLIAAGLSCWAEGVDLIPGELWDEVIPARLATARVMAVLITRRWPEAGKGRADWYSADKIALAIDRARDESGRLRVVPVLLRGGTKARIPYGLRRAAVVELADDDLGRLTEQLARTVAAAADRPAPPPDVRPAAPQHAFWLDPDTIERLVDAWIEQPLDRPLLLSWLDRKLVGALEVKSTPAAQVRADLMALNRVPALDARSDPPLVLWLRQAEHMAKPFPAAAIYADVLDTVRARVAGRG